MVSDLRLGPFQRISRVGILWPLGLAFKGAFRLDTIQSANLIRSYNFDRTCSAFRGQARIAAMCCSATVLYGLQQPMNEKKRRNISTSNSRFPGFVVLNDSRRHDRRCPSQAKCFDSPSYSTPSPAEEGGEAIKGPPERYGISQPSPFVVCLYSTLDSRLSTMFSKLILVAALVVATSAQLPPIDPAELTPAANAGLCLTAGGTTNGSPVTVETCTGSAQQVWNFTASNGGATVSTLNNTMCLDVTGGVDADGTLTQIWSCSSGDPNQNWFYTDDNR